MKKYRKIIPATVLSAIAMLSTGCAEDFLSVTPLTTKTDVTYYLTENDCIEALTGAYDCFQLMCWDGYQIYTGNEIASDFCLAGYGPDSQNQELPWDEFKSNPVWEGNKWEVDWTSCYMALNRINTFLQKVDQPKWSSEVQKMQYKSEAQFLRAFTYFHLVRTFGKCVLLTEPSKENKACSDYKEVYDLIFKDLKDACANGSDDVSTKLFGHANKYAAEALMARAYLYYSGYYGEEPAGCSKAEALAAVNDIIDSKKFGLVDNPYQLWPAAAQYKAYKETGNFGNAYKSGESYSYAGETNKEFIFSIRFTSDSNPWNGDNSEYNSCGWIEDMAPRTIDTKIGNYKKYGYQKGWGGCSVSKFFFDSFETNDSRRDASIIDVKTELEDDIATGEVGSDNEDYTGFHIKKYTVLGDVTDPTKYACEVAGAISFQTGNSQDFVVLRYADVLLMQSELSETVDGMNEVHKRATGVDGYYSSYAKEDLFKERGWELCFEGIRFYDMLRYDGIKGNFAYAKSCFDKIEGETVYNCGAEKKKSYNGAAQLIKHQGLCPIPTNQIQLSNGVLTQNEPWSSEL